MSRSPADYANHDPRGRAYWLEPATGPYEQALAEDYWLQFTAALYRPILSPEDKVRPRGLCERQYANGAYAGEEARDPPIPYMLWASRFTYEPEGRTPYGPDGLPELSWLVGRYPLWRGEMNVFASRAYEPDYYLVTATTAAAANAQVPIREYGPGAYHEVLCLSRDPEPVPYATRGERFPGGDGWAGYYRRRVENYERR